jgi:AcrR family transcriptional regulator
MSRKRGPGRRPGDPEVTKGEILRGAREVFGEVGFDRATIREIAARARVDPALVHHHFGTKQDLFAAAHEFPFNPVQLIEGVMTLPPEARAEAIARMYLTVLGAPGSPVLSLLRAAATNDAAAAMLREFLASILLNNASRLIDYPDARLRIAMLGSHAIGLVLARSVLELPDLADAEAEDLIPKLVPMIERYLFAPDLTARRDSADFLSHPPDMVGT